MQPDHSRARSSAVGPTGVTPASGLWPPPPPPPSGVTPEMHAAANTHDSEMTRRKCCIERAACNQRTTGDHNPHQEHRTRDLECVDHDRVMTHPRGKPCNLAVNSGTARELQRDDCRAGENAAESCHGDPARWAARPRSHGGPAAAGYRGGDPRGARGGWRG